MGKSEIYISGSQSGVEYVGHGVSRVSLARGAALTFCLFRDFPKACTWTISEKVTLRGCRFVRTHIKEPTLGRSSFTECIFEGGSLSGWQPFSSSFVANSFSGRIANTTFFGRDTTTVRALSRKNVFEGNDFTEASFAGVDFVAGIDLSLQKLPYDSSTYLIVNDVSGFVQRIDALLPRLRDNPTTLALMEAVRTISQGALARKDKHVFLDGPPLVVEGVADDLNPWMICRALASE